MILRSDIVEIGMFNKPHGGCGEVSATITLTDFHVVEGMDCLIVNVDNIFVPFFISACRRKSAETYLFTIDGVENEREASMFNNKTIYVMRSAYDKLMQEFDDDELPIDYFVGFSVHDTTSGKPIGEIVDVEDSTANVLFVVETADGDTCLIPAVEDFIVDIDQDKKLVTMALPSGIVGL